MSVVQSEYNERMDPGRRVERDGRTYFIGRTTGGWSVYDKDRNSVDVRSDHPLSDDEILNRAIPRLARYERPG